MAALVKISNKNDKITNSNRKINNQSICAQMNTYNFFIALLDKLHVYILEPAKT